MELMSRDKWLVLDLGEEASRPVHALSLLGKVGSFGAARVMLEESESPRGPWRCVSRFRALGGPLKWQRVDLKGDGGVSSRFVRLYVRREGHATFRHQVHGVQFHLAPELE